MFHVPEMFRVRTGVMRSDPTDGQLGAFQIPSVIPGRDLMVIASAGSDWLESGLEGEPREHVSVRAVSHGRDHAPTWSEMCQMKNVFWGKSDCVIQFHPPEEDYVNTHPYVLHLWRPTITAIPMPPKGCV